MNFKQILVIIVVITIIIGGLYYFMSPYQNCIRIQEERINAKYKKWRINENFTKKDKQRKIDDELIDSKIRCIGGTSW